MNKPSQLAPAFFIINNPNAPRLCPELAQEIGLTESIILLQIEFWIRLTPKEHDGKMWMYDSIGDWKAQFPFLSASTINRAIKSLIKQELVFIGNYNRAKYDRTRWFALNPKGIKRCKSIRWDAPDYENSDESETRSNQNGTRQNQNGTTIPDLSADLSSKDSAIAENLSTDVQIDFQTPEPRRDHSNYKTDVAMAISEFERTGGKPEVSSPRQAEKTFTAKYAPIMAELMGRVYPIDEDRRCAKKLFGKHLDETRINERLNSYRNGEGQQFRKPDATAYWIVNQLEKDLSTKLESSELRVTSRGRNLADY